MSLSKRKCWYFNIFKTCCSIAQCVLLGCQIKADNAFLRLNVLNGFKRKGARTSTSLENIPFQKVRMRHRHLRKID